MASSCLQLHCRTVLLKGTGAQCCPSVEDAKTANILYRRTDGQNVVIAAARAATLYVQMSLPPSGLAGPLPQVTFITSNHVPQTAWKWNASALM